MLHCLGLPYWHYQLVLSWYLHQPESHQLSLQKVTQLERTGPIDRTPGTPGSDKKGAWDWSHGIMVQMKMLLMMKTSPRALSVLCRVMMSVSVGSPVKADHPLSKQDTTSLPFATIPSKQTHEHTQKETHTQMYANSHTQTKDYRKTSLITKTHMHTQTHAHNSDTLEKVSSNVAAPQQC